MKKSGLIVTCFAIFCFLCAGALGAEEILKIHEGNKTKVFRSKKPVIVDVYSQKCPSCMKLQPLFEELRKEYGDQYRFATLEVKDDNLTDYFHIKTIPTILFIKDGEEVGRHTGTLSKKKFRAEIQRYFRE